VRVRTQRGEVPVDQLLVGDMVWAKDVRSGESAFKPVLHTSEGIEKEVLTVHLDGEALAVAPEHLFKTAGNRWVQARHLKPGDVVQRLNGQARVERVEAPKTSKMANIVIEDSSTLFLGRQGILIREGPPPIPESSVPVE